MANNPNDQLAKERVAGFSSSDACVEITYRGRNSSLNLQLHPARFVKTSSYFQGSGAFLVERKPDAKGRFAGTESGGTLEPGDELVSVEVHGTVHSLENVVFSDILTIMRKARRPLKLRFRKRELPQLAGKVADGALFARHMMLSSEVVVFENERWSPAHTAKGGGSFEYLFKLL